MGITNPRFRLRLTGMLVPLRKFATMKIAGFSFVVLMLLNLGAPAQKTDKPVATVGNEKISEREFRMRYELVPHLSPDQENVDTTKKDLLYSIIAEKLLALEARRLGYASSDYYRESVGQISDLYVRDALYKKVVASKVRIGQSDLQKALDRYSRTLKVKIISAGDSSTIFGYYSRLRSGVPFDSIEKYSDVVEYDSNKAPIRITYGQMAEDYVEDTLFNLKPGTFSSPVMTGGGWFIFKLVGVEYRVPPNAGDPDYNKSILEVIRMRKSRVIGTKYLDRFYSDKQAVVDSAIFWSLAGKISSVLAEKERDRNFGEGGYLYLAEGDIMKIAAGFGEISLNKDLVHAGESPITLKEYLYSLLVYPYLVKDPSPQATAYYLMASINKYIQYKFLANEGMNEGLQNKPDVREDIKIWGDDYLAKMLKNTFRDSVHVTDSDVRNYYDESREREKVDVLEILNHDIDTITTVLKKLEEGADFRGLADRYTERSWTRANGGELGYFSVDSFGVIGKTAAGLKMDEVYGPIKTDSGYSVIKLIGRKLQNKQREQVDIREILTHSLDTVETVFRELHAGKNFSALASEYTERSWTRSDSGSFGYFSVYSYGEIGKAASKLKPGQVFGPIVTDSGYSIIKLIGRRYDTTGIEQNFESAKNEIRSELLEKRFNEKFFKYIAGLARKYRYSINEKNLLDLKVINIPMFTYKYIGFGGRITALPYLGPWYEWINYMGEKSKPIP